MNIFDELPIRARNMIVLKIVNWQIIYNEKFDILHSLGRLVRYCLSIQTRIDNEVVENASVNKLLVLKGNGRIAKLDIYDTLNYQQ